MKIKHLFVFSILIISLSSCLKDEPQGRETDITSFKIKTGFYIDTDIRQNEVFVYVTDDMDLQKVAPEIELSPGASIIPASGSEQDFSKGAVTYKVISEDGEYSKNYGVTFIRLSSLNLKFDFEDWKQTASKYYDLQVKTNEGYLVKVWDSGNPGIAFVNSGNNDFPTGPSLTSDSYTGNYAAKMETLYGGVKLGTTINIPIFSGSLFYGRFSLDQGIDEPRKCLRLGRIYPEKYGKPLTFTGYYKYTLGSPYVYLDENKNEIRTDEIKDAFSLYAVLFKVTKGNSADEYLDGITIIDSDKIVARADWKPETREETDQLVDKGFTKFTIPFQFVNGQELDFKNNDYKITIMFASSKDGNEYKGSIGSTLIVDDVEIIYEKQEEGEEKNEKK